MKIPTGYAVMQVLRRVRSAAVRAIWPIQDPPRRSTQFSVSGAEHFDPGAWRNREAHTTVTASTRVYRSMAPEMIAADEYLIATYDNERSGPRTIAIHVDGASDLVLTSVFIGNASCFPMAPNPETGIPAAALRALAVRWPSVNSGIDVCVSFAVRPTVLHRLQPPIGYEESHLVSVAVHASLAFFGPALS